MSMDLWKAGHKNMVDMLTWKSFLDDKYKGKHNYFQPLPDKIIKKKTI